MSKNLEKLQALLAEMFQFDHADLDFGIYRIMNSKRDEISRFLYTDLLPQVKEAFLSFQSADKALLEQQLADTIKKLEELKVDPEGNDVVRDLREKLKSAVDVKALEEEVYSHLTNFFRRYYQDGDFLSLRRYKEGVYAIPYQGEEVKLHWANHDQYYVKTSEYFRDYAFKTSSGRRVHFKLVDADTEKDNIKEEAGKERRFILSADEPYRIENEGLILRFEYRPDAEKRKQAELNQTATTTILAISELGDWLPGLAERRPTDKNENRTLLEKHLADYTARNTFDYFIHKDLGGFLRRELDFYIKNEIMHLDDIQEVSAPKVEEFLSKIKVIRQIAHKIIEFLAQIENFQKKLWLKKKFVFETNYCITLDRIPEEFYPEIAANDTQRKAWVRQLAIDEIDATTTGPAYTSPLSVSFLKEYPHLPLDTRFFSNTFRDRVVASQDNLGAGLDGLLVHAENLQTLILLKATYGCQIKCMYIDPPYNSDASPILYQNGYKISSWNSLIADRLSASRQLLTSDGLVAVAIDDVQYRELNFILSDTFSDNLLGTFCVRSNPSGRPTKAGYSVAHEYVIFAGNSPTAMIGRMPPTPEQLARFSEVDDQGVFEWRNLRREGSNSDRSARPFLYYPIYLTPESIRVPAMDWDEASESWIPTEAPRENEQVIYPTNEDGVQKTWRWESETVMSSLDKLAVRKDRPGRDYVYYKRRPHEEGVVSISTWFDAKYSSTEHGTAILKDLFGRPVFSYPKSIHTVEDSIYIGGGARLNAIVCDYFAGSGTTAHAVINLNRRDNGKRKYILAEVEAYFDSVIIPRIIKLIYSKDWKDGKPLSHTGISHAFKYIRLESYEDALNNIEFKRTEAQQELLDESKEFRESYLLSYMLDTESKDSASLLNISAFEDPFNYKLKVSAGSVGETRLVNVDLVETFNYLIGLTVRHIDWIRGFCVVEGTDPKNEKVLVIWRNTKEKSNEDLEAFFNTLDIRTKDKEFDLIYVNGDNNLENIRREDETWKVRMIEEDFFRLMFEEEDI